MPTFLWILSEFAQLGGDLNTKRIGACQLSGESYTRLTARFHVVLQMKETTHPNDYKKRTSTGTLSNALLEIWWLASSFSLTEVYSSFTDNHATKDHTNFSLSNSFTGPDLITFLKERSIIPLQGTFIAEGSTPTLKPVNSAAQASQSKSSCSASNIA